MFLEVKDLRKSYGDESNRTEVLRGIDSADSGYVSIQGEKTGDMSEKALTRYRRNHLGYVFQMYNLIPNLNVKENIEVGAYLSRDPMDIQDLLETLGLYEHCHKLPNHLSGGQQQRTAIGVVALLQFRHPEGWRRGISGIVLSDCP